MTDEQRAYWQGYVDTLKPIMRLWHWRIDLGTESAAEGSDASLWMSDDYHTACLYFSPEWETFDRDKQRDAIVHELIHVHLARMGVCGKKIVAQLGGQAKELADEMQTHFLEAATEELARVIAPFLPLPPKAKKERG